MDTRFYQKPGNDFDTLSFMDLLEARDLYHVHLMNYPKVVATAIGRYRIRSEDSWPEYLNLDAGLIDIENLDRWTAQVHGLGTLGPMADLPPSQMKLSLVGSRVAGYGAASGRMEGEITALLYRYKSVGGFEYLADFLIGPRTGGDLGKRGHPQPELLTRPGDSGTLWVFDPTHAPNQPSVP
jgi:hypothetical protein